MPHFTFLVTTREARDLRRAARVRGIAMASVARRLVFRFFGVRASKRRVSGPSAAKTATAMRRVRG